MSARTLFHLQTNFLYKYLHKTNVTDVFWDSVFTKITFDLFRLSALSHFFIFKTEPCA